MNSDLINISKKQMKKIEQVSTQEKNESKSSSSLKSFEALKHSGSSSRKITNNEESLVFSTRRSRRYKPVDTTRDVIVLMPNIDAKKRMGVSALEADDFQRCMDDIVEYEEDSDGDVQPIAYVSLPSALNKEIHSRASAINKVVHIPRVTLSSDDLQRPLSRSPKVENNNNNNNPSSPGYRIASSSSDPSELSTYGADKNTLPSFPDDQDYDCDEEDELFVQLCNAVIARNAGDSLGSSPSRIMTETALEQLIASLEQQLEWAYDNFESFGSAHNAAKKCE